MYNKINDTIITTLGINALPVEQQKEAIERLGGIVYQEVMIRVLDQMEEEDKNEFEKLLATNPDPETMFKFLAEKVPEIDTIVTEEAEKLRGEATEIMGQIGQ